MGRLLTFLLLTVLCVSAQAQVGLRSPAFVANLHPASTWTPTSPTNSLLEWLKADKLVMTDGAAVATWTNNAGTDAVQATGSKQPLFKTNIKNGLPVVRFDGVDDFLANPAMGQENQPFTVFLVFKFNAAAATAVAFDGNSSAIQRACLFHDGTSGTFQMYSGGAAGVQTVATNANWHIVKLEFNGASSKWQFDGGTDTTAATDPGSNPILGFTLGAFYSGLLYFASIDIGELIWYGNGPLNSTDKAAALAYLNGRWAVY